MFVAVHSVNGVKVTWDVQSILGVQEGQEAGQ